MSGKRVAARGGGAAQVAANPFQSWAAQRALSDYLIAQDNPLTFLYHLAHWPPLDEYFLPPAERYQFRDWPSARLLLLGEVGQTFVEGTERLAWRLTHRLRRMEPTPISQFSAMLYELLRDEDELESQEVAEIKLADRFAGAYEGVRHLPNGEEVAESFASIDRLLQTETIPDLAEAYKALAWLDSLAEPYLRPPVVESLKALSDMSLDIADFFSPATAMSQQAAALNRTAGALNQLAGYIEKEVKPPEQVLLARVVRHWQAIVAQKQGELGEAALQEMSPRDRDSTMVIRRKSAVWQRPLVHFDNPYIAGDPVYPPLFVGRKDVFDRINTVWSAKSNPDSIILFGHRRMGKSSILRNLDQVAREGSLIVYADMAGETSFVESTADLLLGLADKMHAAMRRAYPQASLPEPDSAAYDTPARAQREFNRLTGQIRDVLDGQSLILALDEFEAVERAVKAEKIGKEIFQFLRTKTQEPWLTLVFGGLHTLDEMSRDYHQPFYGSYENIRVSYLSREAAWRLITNPTTDFALNYELEAVERIIAATGGQPYLVQQVCRDALDHLNHELIDLNKEREVRISQADVEAALGNEFFRRGTVYFDGVWTQASQPQQQALLRAVAQRDEPWSADELEATTRLDPEGLRRQLRWAERHDILRKIDGDSPQWEFYVPLMRQWIKNRR